MHHSQGHCLAEAMKAKHEAEAKMAKLQEELDSMSTELQSFKKARASCLSSMI